MIIGKRNTWKEIHKIERCGKWYNVVESIRLFISMDGELFRYYKKFNKSERTFGYGKRYKKVLITCEDENKKHIKFEILVHRLVAYAFLNKKEVDEDVNHKDGNPSNNNVNNLEWVTHIENVRHALDTGLTPIKHTTETIQKISELLMKGLSNREISDIMCESGCECSIDQIHRIRNKENYARFTKQYSFPLGKTRKPKDRNLAIKINELMKAGFTNKEIIKELSLRDIYKPNNLNAYLHRIRHKMIWKDDLTT